MKRQLWLLALVGMVLLIPPHASADGDFYVIVAGSGVGAKISSLPYTISTPGFYYLADNLTAASGDGIIVNDNNVTIDLMGFSLNGNSNKCGIIMAGRNNVEIRNGTLSGWAYGIFESSVDGSSHRVLNVRAKGNTWGIMLNGTGHLIKGCTVLDSTANQGIWVEGGGASTISGNVVRNCKVGIQLGAGGIVVGNSVTSETGQTGIVLSFESAKPIMVDQNSVVGAGTHYSGGSNATAWGTNAGR
jgi:parallel beta-helix repeat protein